MGVGFTRAMVALKYPVVLSTDSRREAELFLSQILTPVRIIDAPATEGFSLALRAANIGHARIVELSIAGGLCFETERFKHLAIHAPIGGLTEISSGDWHGSSHGATGVLLANRLRYSYRFDAPASFVAILLPREQIAQHTERYLKKRDHVLAIEDGTLDLAGKKSAFLFRMIGDLAAQIHDNEAELSEGLAEALERAIAFAVLEAIVEQFGADALVRRGNPSPRHVKRAEEFMREHLSAQLDLDKLAEVSGVSSRTLQRGFQQFRGTSVVQVFKDLRLDRAREWLTDPREQRSLKQIAADVGFASYATFWRSYSQRYGESPSDTNFRTIRERWMTESKDPPAADEPK